MVSLRGLYDTIEKRATPVIEDVVHSDRFSDVATTAMKLRKRAGRAFENVAADVLHTVNLPAGSDVRRLRRQIGELDYEIRRLRLELAERATEKEAGDGTDS